MNETFFLIIAYLGATLSGIFGIGNALLLISFGSFFLALKKVIALATIFFIASNISKIVIYWKHIDWKNVFLLWIGGIPTVIVGALLMTSTPTMILEKILGGIVLLYVLNDFFPYTKHLKLRTSGMLFGSGLYGFFAGIVGTGDAIKAILLTHIGLRKEAFVATMACSALLLNLIKTGIYSRSALLHSEDIHLILILIVLAFAGVYTGKMILKRIHPDVFKRGLLFLLALVGLKFLLFS